jgi:hypothetical protein
MKSRNTEFHTYEPKQERIFKIDFKHIHITANLDDIRKGIANQGHIVTNIWDIEKQGTDKAFPMFYVELELESNNKDIYEVGSLQCKVKFESLYH